MIFELLLLASGAEADGKVFNSWSYFMGAERNHAVATINDSGQIFGRNCNADNSHCSWQLVLATKCDADAEYPVLGASAQGASALTLKCAGKTADGEKYRYQFTSIKDLSGLIGKPGKIGFAFPIDDGTFTVIRFELQGMSEALTYANGRAKSSTADLKL